MKDFSTFKILSIDPAVVYSIGLRAVFKSVFNLEVLSAQTMQEALLILRYKKVDFVYIEIYRNGDLDFGLIQQLSTLQPQLKIVVFTDYEPLTEIKKKIKDIPNCFTLRKNATQFEIIESIRLS